MKIFLTGATGVIGTRVLPRLIGAGHEVSVVARTAEQVIALGRAGAIATHVDLFSPGSVGDAIRGHETVINLATHIPAMTGRMLMPGAWRENDRLRKVASANLATAAIEAGVGRFIQESFAPVYPDRGDAWIDESVPIAPVRYNRTVADAEAAALRFGEHGVGVVLRFAAFYGPDAEQTHVMANTVRKGWAPLPGSPEAFISSISHDDAAAAVVAALDLRGGIYNVTDDEPLRRRDFADSLAAALGAPPPRPLPLWITRVGGSLIKLMSRSQRISNAKLRGESGWAPKYASVRAGWHAAVSSGS